MDPRTSEAKAAERSKGTMFPPEYLKGVAHEMGFCRRENLAMHAVDCKVFYSTVLQHLEIPRLLTILKHYLGIALVWGSVFVRTCAVCGAELRS